MLNSIHYFCVFFIKLFIMFWMGRLQDNQEIKMLKERKKGQREVCTYLWEQDTLQYKYSVFCTFFLQVSLHCLCHAQILTCVLLGLFFLLWVQANSRIIDSWDGLGWKGSVYFSCCLSEREFHQLYFTAFSQLDYFQKQYKGDDNSIIALSKLIVLLKLIKNIAIGL